MRCNRALLTAARLPGGGYCCQAAMFAVLLRLGFVVPAAFAGVMIGFAFSFAAGDIVACWQLPACTVEPGDYVLVYLSGRDESGDEFHADFRLGKEDTELLARTIDEIIANNPKAAEQYRSGDQKVFGFFMGQANKALKGAASPKAIQEYIRKKLSE